MKNEHDAHNGLRASVGTTVRATNKPAARWHAGHGLVAMAIIAALVVASQHVGAIVTVVRGFL